MITYVGICPCFILAIIIASLLPLVVVCWIPIAATPIKNYQIAFQVTSCSSSSSSSTGRRKRLQADNRKVAANRVALALPVCWSSVQAQDDDEEDGDGDGNSSYRRALQIAEEEAFQKFIQDEAPSWLKEEKVMPFACTECGKCCKTQGSVYLSPQEIENAAALLGTETTEAFIQKYASHTISDSNADQVWIRLRETIISPNDTTPSCIFLDPDTNYCRIYEARPVQCRTYPFWPSILKSRETWNNECRRQDDDDEEEEDKEGDNEDDTVTFPPSWSPEIGGCEGMTPIVDTCDEEEEEIDNEIQVPMDEAYKELYNYIVDDRRLPSGDEMPVK